MKARFVCLLSLVLSACNTEIPEVDTFQASADGGSSGSSSGEGGSSASGGDCGCKDGEQGAPGKDGADGAPGQRGADGRDGDRGEKGDQGERGDTGLQGTPGTQGLPGTNGARGDTGAQGAKGAQGIQGSKGDTGLPGAVGAKGDTGADGTKITKASVYVVKADAYANEIDFVRATAKCADVNDVVLSGSCEFFPTGGTAAEVDWSVVTSGAWNTALTTDASSWVCEAFLRTDGLAFQVTAKVTCLITND